MKSKLTIAANLVKRLRHGNPCLRSIKITDGVATATDLESWIQFPMPEISGSYLLDPDVVKLMKKASKIVENDGALFVDNLKAPLTGADIKEYPEMGRIKFVGLPKAFHINASPLAHAFAATENMQSRYALNGVAVDTKNGGVCGTDGKRMFCEKYFKESGFIIPASAAPTWISLLKLPDSDSAYKISKDKNWMLARVGDITVISRRLDGEYPDVSQVVPEANSSDSAVIKVKEILDAVELALKHPSVKKGGMTPRSNFKFADGSCTLEPPGITVPVEGKTQPSARFDLRYLRDAIKTGNGAEKILWHQKSEDTPLRIDSALGIYVVVSINVR